MWILWLVMPTPRLNPRPAWCQGLPGADLSSETVREAAASGSLAVRSDPAMEVWLGVRDGIPNWLVTGLREPLRGEPIRTDSDILELVL
jgi:hypothetical protein